MSRTRQFTTRAAAFALLAGTMAVAACSSPDYVATTQRSTTTTTRPIAPMTPMVPPAMATTTTTTSHTVSPTP